MCNTSKNVSCLYEQILGSGLPYYFFAKKVMPEKLRRVFWTQGRASKLVF